jgi:hypothetical protein
MTSLGTDWRNYSLTIDYVSTVRQGKDHSITSIFPWPNSTTKHQFHHVTPGGLFGRRLLTFARCAKLNRIMDQNLFPSASPRLTSQRSVAQGESASCMSFSSTWTSKELIVFNQRVALSIHRQILLAPLGCSNQDPSILSASPRTRRTPRTIKLLPPTSLS